MRIFGKMSHLLQISRCLSYHAPICRPHRLLHGSCKQWKKICSGCVCWQTPPLLMEINPYLPMRIHVQLYSSKTTNVFTINNTADMLRKRISFSRTPEAGEVPANIVPVGVIVPDNSDGTNLKIVIVPLDLVNQDAESLKNTLNVINQLRQHAKEIDIFTDSMIEDVRKNEKKEEVAAIKKKEQVTNKMEATKEKEQVTKKMEDLHRWDTYTAKEVEVVAKSPTSNSTELKVQPAIGALSAQAELAPMIPSPWTTPNLPNSTPSIPVNPNTVPITTPQTQPTAMPLADPMEPQISATPQNEANPPESALEEVEIEMEVEPEPEHAEVQQITIDVPEQLGQQLSEMAISSMHLSFEMDMTNIRDAILHADKGTTAENQNLDSDPMVFLETQVKVDPAHEAEITVPLQFNAHIKGIVDIDAEKLDIEHLTTENLPLYNDAVTSMAANICSTALQQGFATESSDQHYPLKSSAQARMALKRHQAQKHMKVDQARPRAFSVSPTVAVPLSPSLRDGCKYPIIKKKKKCPKPCKLDDPCKEDKCNRPQKPQKKTKNQVTASAKKGGGKDSCAKGKGGKDAKGKDGKGGKDGKKDPCAKKGKGGKDGKDKKDPCAKFKKGKDGKGGKGGKDGKKDPCAKKGKGGKGGKDGKKDPCAKLKKSKDGKGGKDGKKDPCAKFKKGKSGKGGKDGKKDPCAKFKKGKDGKGGKGGKDGKKDPCAKLKKGKDGKSGKDGKKDPCAKFKKGKSGKGGKDGKKDPCAKFKKGKSGKGGKGGKKDPCAKKGKSGKGDKDGKKDPCAKFKKGKGGKGGKDGKNDPCAKFKKGKSGKGGKDGKKDPCKKKYSTLASPVSKFYHSNRNFWHPKRQLSDIARARFTVYSTLVRRHYGGKRSWGLKTCVPQIESHRTFAKKKDEAQKSKCNALQPKSKKRKHQKARSGLRTDCYKSHTDECSKSSSCKGKCDQVKVPRKKCEKHNKKPTMAKMKPKPKKKLHPICGQLNQSKKGKDKERNKLLRKGSVILNQIRMKSDSSHSIKRYVSQAIKEKCVPTDDEPSESVEVVTIPSSYLICKEQKVRPKLKKYDVLIRTGSVALTGSDIHVYENADRDIEGITLGHDATGFVEEIGSCVQNLHVGDRVVMESALSCGICDFCKQGLYNICTDLVYNGFLASHQSHPADLCHRLPDTVTMEEGTLTQTLAMGCQACFKANITPTSNVLIIGSTPTAVAAAMCAAAIGAKKVIIAGTIVSSLETIYRDFGVTTIHFDTNALFGEVLEAVYKQFDAWPNCAINCAIAPMTMNLAVMALQPCSVCVLSECECECASFNALDVLMKNIRIIPSFRSANMFPTALTLMTSGRAPMKKFIAKTFPWSMLDQAFRCAQHESNTGLRKIIVNSTEGINIGRLLKKKVADYAV